MTGNEYHKSVGDPIDHNARVASKDPAMKDPETISAVYERIDNQFEELQERCRNTDEWNHIVEEQRLNDQAYFILA